MIRRGGRRAASLCHDFCYCQGASISERDRRFSRSKKNSEAQSRGLLLIADGAQAASQGTTRGCLGHSCGANFVESNQN
jgi:hypothetical protein